MRGHVLQFFGGHPVFDVLFHLCQSDAELVFQQFTDQAEPAIAQMVDVIQFSDSIEQVEVVRNGGDDVGSRDVKPGLKGIVAQQFDGFLFAVLTKGDQKRFNVTIADDPFNKVFIGIFGSGFFPGFAGKVDFQFVFQGLIETNSGGNQIPWLERYSKAVSSINDFRKTTTSRSSGRRYRWQTGLRPLFPPIVQAGDNVKFLIDFETSDFREIIAFLVKRRDTKKERAPSLVAVSP